MGKVGTVPHASQDLKPLAYFECRVELDDFDLSVIGMTARSNVSSTNELGVAHGDDRTRQNATSPV
jgi:hypothetical protein